MWKAFSQCTLGFSLRKTPKVRLKVSDRIEKMGSSLFKAFALGENASAHWKNAEALCEGVCTVETLRQTVKTAGSLFKELEQCSGGFGLGFCLLSGDVAVGVAAKPEAFGV
jgi:hypothetical protein